VRQSLSTILAIAPGGTARSQRRTYATILGVFVLLLLIALVASWAATEVINSTRAYATGEGRYSKAEKMAVLDLHRYVYSRDQKDYETFLDMIVVPRGDHMARVALSQAPVDFEAAAKGFLQGQNHTNDVGGMIRLFRLFWWWTPFAAAVEDWRIGDGLVDELVAQGELVHELVVADRLGDQDGAALLTRIDALDNLLTDRENTFSMHMGEAARTAKALVVFGLGLTTILLWAGGIIFVIRLFRQQIALDDKLASSEGRFRDYAEVASDWYWEMDRDDQITYVSERFYEIVRLSPGEVIGISGSDLFRRNSQSSGHRDEYLLAISEHRAFRGLKLRLTMNDGADSYWSISGKPRLDPVGEFGGYRGVGTDITSQVNDAQMLMDAKNHAEVANRAKSEFLANMSHELRTPLNAILGFSEIIHQRTFGTNAMDRYADYAGDIHQSGSHLLSIINDLLDLSKIEAGQTTLEESETGLDAIVREVRTLLADHISQQRVAFIVNVPSPPPRLLVDERKFVQILVNLLSNAFKFTPQGGTVTLLGVVQGDGRLAVTVRDTGIGIAPGDMDTVRAPFGQVESAFSRKHHGTGLGLPLANSLAVLHGGSLTIESTKGAGTAVTVFLPASRVVATFSKTARFLA
jgi:PAS domain S-box-containing protein